MTGWLGSLRERAARITPGTLLVRGAAFVFAAGALLVAFPGEILLWPGAAVALVACGAAPALAPRTRLTTMVLFLAVGGWIVATTTYAEPVTWARLATLACLLYLVHTTAALAAVVPYDTVVAPAVLVRWLARTAVVLALTVGFAVASVVGVRVVSGQAYLVAAVAGVLLVAALAGLLTLSRRS
ncbi:hypothetical protein HC028_10215 [Planosporangium flavigriseum]|uniref:Uncharacterized protein n=1 Tax=Planosporangium flavigriseum TaxID=373681 RepID=A0A8J3PMB9_9ACTN|nr:hypothetical protein [Planosporangium flavigriseum]NJC64874.1 hypothetical protein [Planosporangium flavigriseum]GIG72746.1 hypothetical protein Pfl04_11500 [Planosporangium flavigriseum]